MTLTDARAILGIGPFADLEEVTRAYRARLREVHPDIGGTAEALRAVLRAHTIVLAAPALGSTRVAAFHPAGSRRRRFWTRFI